MAYRRYLLRRGNLVDWKFHPSFSYVLHTDEAKRQRQDEKPSTRSFGSSLYRYGSVGFRASSSPHRMLSNNALLSPCTGYSFCRYMSTANDGSDKTDFVTDVAGVLAETTVDAAAPSHAAVVNEVAIAAADSFLPVKVLQYVIDAVHSYTGLNWWAAIILTTLLIRTATVPFLINQLRANSKFTLMRLRMEEIKAEIEDKATDPAAVAEGQKQMEKLFKEHGVSPFPSLQGLFIQGPIFVSFLLAVTNMAEKMPSFKHGGAFWFTDLTTPDALYIFPVLTALSLLTIVEHNIQEGSDGTLVEGSGTMRNLSRAFAVLVVPFTMGLPKAIFCFWLTSNLFSITYGLVLRVPGVKRTLGIPEIVVAAPTSSPQSQP